MSKRPGSTGSTATFVTRKSVRWPSGTSPSCRPTSTGPGTHHRTQRWVKAP